MRISDWSSDVCSSDLIFGEARIDEHRLAFRHDNARLGIDQFRQRVKIVLVIDEVVSAIERVLVGSNGVHAASARRARHSSEATIVSTSRIRATAVAQYRGNCNARDLTRKSEVKGKEEEERVE